MGLGRKLVGKREKIGFKGRLNKEDKAIKAMRIKVMRIAMSKKVSGLRLDKVADELIASYGLKRGIYGRRFLAHHLRMGVLKSIGKRAQEQENAFRILHKATTIELAFLLHGSRAVPIEEAMESCEAALEIAQIALEKHVKGDWGKEIALLCSEIDRMDAKLGKRIPPQKTALNGARLLVIANLANALVDIIMPKNFFANKGFQEADAVAAWAFSRGRMK